jgi:SAM-dependent methyltransferase
MPFADNEFDTVIVEAVTMFVNREKAVREIRRVCKPGGKVVEHEFVWRKKPTPEARRIFEGEVCPGIKFDTSEDWIKLYEANGFKNEKSATGPFIMMSPMGFLQDEGIRGTLALMTRTFSRAAYLRKMIWLMPRILKVRSSLGYIVFSNTKVA